MGWLLEKQPAPACPKTSCKLTWVSERLRFLASSFLSCPTTYWFFSNACSSFNNWFGEKAVRIRFGFRNGSKNSGKFGPEKRQHVKILSILCERAKDWLSSDEDLMVGVLMAFIRKRANYDEHGCRTHCVGMPGTLPEALALLNSQN